MDPDLPAADHPAHMRAWEALRRPVWLFDPHRLCGVYANPAALKLWGADSLPELLARDFSQLSEAVKARTARLAQATADGGEVAERWTVYPNGRPATVQATISTYRLDDGRPCLLFEASPLEVEVEDCRAVEALRHTCTLITLFDEAGHPIFSNPAAFSAYGLSAPPFARRFADPARGDAVFAKALAGEVVSEVCEMFGGVEACWHHLDARKVTDPATGRTSLLLNQLDVTRRIRAEQARLAAEQKTAMAQARERFLTDMSHELRTPLNAVIGFSDLLRRSPLTAAQVEQAGRIHESGGHLLRVVNQMIGLSEMDGWTGEASAAAAPSDPPPPALSDPAGLDEAEALEGRPLRVLYVDDNAHNRALVTAILVAQGVECHTADDGSQGAQAASTGGWDLILMDIQMPLMDGIQATRSIRALTTSARAVPILAVTANTLPNQLQAYSDAGMDDCIAKPIDVAVLLDRVAYWIETPPVEQRLAN